MSPEILPPMRVNSLSEESKLVQGREGRVLRSVLPPKLCGPWMMPLTPQPPQGFWQRGLVNAQVDLVSKFT